MTRKRFATCCHKRGCSPRSRVSSSRRRDRVLRLLLDEHVHPEIATQMQATYPEIPVASLHTWEEGRYLRSSDAVILLEAHRHGLTLVTYDTRTIVPLLKMWGEQGIAHGGVIFVKSSTISQDNI